MKNRQMHLEEISNRLYTEVSDFLAYINDTIQNLTNHATLSKLDDETPAYAQSIIDRYKERIAEIRQDSLAEYLRPGFVSDYLTATYCMGLLYQFTGDYQNSIQYYDDALRKCNDLEASFHLSFESSMMKYMSYVQHPESWKEIILQISQTALLMYGVLEENYNHEYIEGLFNCGIPADFLLSGIKHLKMKNHPYEGYHHGVIAYLYMEMKNYTMSHFHLTKAYTVTSQKSKVLPKFLEEVESTLTYRENNK